MASGLTTQFNATLRGLLRPSTAVGDVRADDTVGASFYLSNGTGAGQSDLKYFARRTLGAASNETLDLSGVLANQFGTTLTMAKIKAIAISNPSTNNGDLTIGGAASNAWTAMFTGTLLVPPGGAIVFGGPGAGKAVTAGTGDQLKVANGGSAPVNYDILIIATSV